MRCVPCCERALMRVSELQYSFWLTEGRPGATANALATAERIVGVRFPQEYRLAMMIQDGGVSSYSSFRRGDYGVPLVAFFSVSEVVEAHENRHLFSTPPGIVAVASGGHEWIGFDYRRGGHPRIVFQEDEDAAIEHVADSFEQFLDGFVP